MLGDYQAQPRAVLPHCRITHLTEILQKLSGFVGTDTKARVLHRESDLYTTTIIIIIIIGVSTFGGHHHHLLLPAAARACERNRAFLRCEPDGGGQ